MKTFPKVVLRIHRLGSVILIKWLLQKKNTELHDWYQGLEHKMSNINESSFESALRHKLGCESRQIFRTPAMNSFCNILYKMEHFQLYLWDLAVKCAYGHEFLSG